MLLYGPGAEMTPGLFSAFQPGKIQPAGSEKHAYRWYSGYNMWNDCEICQKYEQILKKNKYIDGWLMCGIIQM